ncbi:class I SAM-dependent methyltransferase [Roseibium sp.]|uniref:class I SAM-dependent methyltransferase n=1 Tax=Roseibium sp. TaxID=1936156 RepID=UPI003B5176B6
MSDTAETAHLMDAVYRHQRHFYDLTRKYYLLGRDLLIRDLAPPDDGVVLELGCGTGRNLIAAAKCYPTVQFYGLDISNHMLQTARTNIEKAGLEDRITLIQGDASDPDAINPLGITEFDRVFFSYTLSMMPIWREALSAGLTHLAPGGRIHIVDFGLQERLPGWFKSLLLKWLASFHVTPRADLKSELESLAENSGATYRYAPLYRGYAVTAEIRKDG